MSVPNFVQVTSSTHFQELLSADLNRVSLINFFAEWAEPCKQMNAVALELAKKHPGLLVLQVEAEQQEDITESFEIEAVPSVVLLRGHTLLARIAGGDAAGVTTAVNLHLGKVQPTRVDDYAEKGLPQEQLNERMRALMNQSKVVLFMKGRPENPQCGFSRKAVNLLKEQNVEFTHFDILQDQDVRQGLKEHNQWPTFPQFIVNGEFIGGLDVVQEMADNGELNDVLAV
ncbi:hypothetical protein HYDPIDRAFT_93734 [Hydnomerulius pinastri MD-312]|uniref:Glutaredoxin n=1 Tax=Hydnomerulius pinastri MD-312 TaxID=994086 RepID=A0A0C9WDF1_9AGAM|nr:hypothetical protein HYDPIDRAFT_93734 [Hydnomerulius pinastri MD-312]